MPGMIVTVRLFEDELVPSLTVAVNVYVPAVVGVPDRLPSLESVRPGGSCPPVTDQVRDPAPPDAFNATE